MEQQHPAEPVDALIKYSVVCNALDKVKVGEVPHAPISGKRTAEMKDKERSRREYARDRADKRGGRSSASGEEEGDDGQHVNGEIQYPQGYGNGISPIEGLADMIPVVNKYGNDHDDCAGGNGSDDFSVKLCVQQPGCLLL